MSFQTKSFGQLTTSYFLINSPVNGHFYSLESPFYLDFSATSTFDFNTLHFQQYQLNVQYNIKALSSAFAFSLVSENQFLVQQQFFSSAYLYALKLNRNSDVQFYSSISYSHQQLNRNSLLFPSQLSGGTGSAVELQNMVPSSGFFSMNGGLNFHINKANFYMAAKNMAILYSKGGLMNKKSEFYAEINYQLNQLSNLNKQAIIYQPLVAINKFDNTVLEYMGIKLIQRSYFGELRVGVESMKARNFTIGIGISLVNVIFAYQNTTTLMKLYSTNLNYNGIKIVYQFKKNEKSDGHKAISCPQF